MAFMIHKQDHNQPIGIEYLPAGAITPKIGMALTQTNGLLAVAAGTTKPQYISMTDRDSACTSGELIPVIRVAEDTVFETSFSAAAASVKLGSKVTVSADGLQVTATTADGVAEVIYMDGTAKDDMVRVRFPA